jgi:hypothetical protein
MLTVLAAFALAAILPWVPFLLKDPGTAAQPFTYHAQRPLQLESVLGTPWAASALAGSAHPTIVHAFGSQNYAGGGPDAVAALSPWLMVLAVGAVYALVWRRRHALRAAPQLVPVAALAVLLTAICASKVLSPQFLIWTFPVVALCVAQQRWLPRFAALATGVSVLLTQVEFPARYWDLVALDPAPLALLVIRNLTLVVGAALAVAALATLRSEAAASTAAVGDTAAETLEAAESPAGSAASTSRS